MPTNRNDRTPISRPTNRGCSLTDLDVGISTVRTEISGWTKIQMPPWLVFKMHAFH